MRRGARILLAAGAGLAAGIASNLAIAGILGRAPIAGGALVATGYLLGILPGLPFDPIEIAVEIAVAIAIYALLPGAPAAPQD